MGKGSWEIALESILGPDFPLNQLCLGYYLSGAEGVGDMYQMSYMLLPSHSLPLKLCSQELPVSHNSPT